MKQKIKTSAQHTWQISYTTPEGKQGTFRCSDNMLAKHKQLLQGNSCIKNFEIKPII